MQYPAILPSHSSNNMYVAVPYRNQILFLSPCYSEERKERREQEGERREEGEGRRSEEKEGERGSEGEGKERGSEGEGEERD